MNKYGKLLNPIFLKFCYSSYMVSTLHNLKILLTPLCLFHPTISKFYQLSTWNFFGMVIPFKVFEIGRNYESIIVTIISNITVLLSHKFTWYGYFISMSHVVNKKASPIVSPHPSPFPSFDQVCLLFCKKYFISLLFLWSDYCEK